MPNPPGAQSLSEPKSRGANRSTKAAGKLKVLPEQPDLPEVNQKPERKPPGPARISSDLEESAGTTGDSDDADVDDDDEPEVRAAHVVYFCVLSCTKVYNQLSLIPEGTAKRDALRLTKKKAKSLPRVTAYATARCCKLSVPGNSLTELQFISYEASHGGGH